MKTQKKVQASSRQVKEALPSTAPATTEASEPDALLEIGTPSGRLYRDRRWTLGSSNHLVEGEPPEPMLVTVAWIVVPVLLAAVVVWRMLG